jgi:CheY-like chemotaxis protein
MRGPPIDTGSSDAGRPGLRVLVADDSRDCADLMATLLRLWGHDPRVAYSGEDALGLARRIAFDVALLDIEMPGVDGWEVARRLGGLPRPPLVVAVTGHGLDEDRRRSYQSGVHLHLLKPVSPVTLGSVLDRFQRAAG